VVLMLSSSLFNGKIRDDSPLEFEQVELRTTVGNLQPGTKFDGATIDLSESTLTFYNLDAEGDVKEHHSYTVRLSLDPNELKDSGKQFESISARL